MALLYCYSGTPSEFETIKGGFSFIEIHQRALKQSTLLMRPTSSGVNTFFILPVIRDILFSVPYNSLHNSITFYVLTIHEKSHFHTKTELGLE